MLTRAPIARLDDEDLVVLRSAVIRVDALEYNPRAYSQGETESILLRYHTLMSEFAKRYNLGELRSFTVCKWTGNIWEIDEE